MRRSTFLLSLLLAAASLPALAHDGSQHAPAAAAGDVPPEIREAKARAYFTDLPVFDQYGTELRFFTDVLKGKTVLIYLFYTGCGDACPLINAKLADVQDVLGDRIGKDILLISLTVDPENDTVSVLQDYANKFEAGRGWVFLTGAKDDIAQILRKLGATSPDPADHTAALFLGNVDEARWRKLPASYSHVQLAEVLRLLAGDKQGG
jgi:protein SCO1